MDDNLKYALEIIKAQAGVREMTADEMASMLQKLCKDVAEISNNGKGEDAQVEEDSSFVADPAKAIKEKNIICVICGKSFKLLTQTHLATHDLTPDAYRELCGYKKGLALVCKKLQRERRTKMRDMKLWERRRYNAPVDATSATEVVSAAPATPLAVEATKKTAAKSTKKVAPQKDATA